MVTVCQTCGDHGFGGALIYCESCEAYAVHRYCLDRMPTNFKEYISWFCADCDGAESGSDHTEIDQAGKLVSVLKKNENKRNSGTDEKNKKIREGSPEILARLEDHRLERGADVESMEVCSSSSDETAKDFGRRGSLGSGSYQELSGLKRNGASLSEASNASILPEYDSSTYKQRKLSLASCDEECDSSKSKTPLGALIDRSNRLQLPFDDKQSAARKNSCKVVGSYIPHSERLTDKCFSIPEPNGNVRAQPIIEPVWRGSLSIKQGSWGSVMLVAHLSSLACPRVFETARSLPSCLSAEMPAKMDIWPKSFVKSGGPSDESIGLFFFPSSKSDEKVFDALVDEMMGKDLAAITVLDNAELLLFTSYALPMQSWRFQSKFYLWGAFRGKQASRHQSLHSTVAEQEKAIKS